MRKLATPIYQQFWFERGEISSDRTGKYYFEVMFGPEAAPLAPSRTDRIAPVAPERTC